MAENVNGANFDAEVLQSKIPVLVDFYADWCGPCRAMTPALNEVSEQADGKYKVVKVNSDEEHDLCVKYNIMSLPTLMVFKEGKPVTTLKGMQSKTRMLEVLGG